MEMERRTFLKVTSLGSAGLFASSKMSVAAEPQLTTVDISLIGGFAYVFQQDQLVVGTVMSRHHPFHDMELRLDDGEVIDRTHLVPSNSGGNASPHYIRRWILNGRRNISVSGLPTDGVRLPKESSNFRTPRLSDDWNDLAFVHQPLRYHTGANLVKNWDAQLHSSILFQGGTLNVVKPQHACMLNGIWRGEALSDAKVEHFRKPLASTLQLKATTSQPLVFTIGSETLSFTPKQGSNRLALTLIAASPLPEMTYRDGARQEDQGMFYELIHQGNKPIGHADQVIPAFVQTNGQTCEPTDARIPGEGCSPSFFRLFFWF